MVIHQLTGVAQARAPQSGGPYGPATLEVLQAPSTASSGTKFIRSTTGFS